jgi:hypothetical protein
VLIVCGALGGAALAASTAFIEPQTSPEPAGTSPSSVAAADFDGDGDQDLAVANGGSDNVTILRNTGLGNFRHQASGLEAAGDKPRSVAAADLDGDGDQDLAVANQVSDNVTILRNNGNGHFAQPASSPEPAGDIPFSVAAADLDGDTDQDLAVANAGSSDVTILRNDGHGAFVQPASSPEPAGHNARAIAAADLDGDTDQDLAVANFSSNKVTILRNDGNGDFVQPASSPEAAGTAPESVAAADFDGDTDQDLAVGNVDSNSVTILRNVGAGNFVVAQSSPETTGLAPSSVAAADFDDDGDQDLAVANGGSDNVTILRNTGLGNFVEPSSSPEGAFRADDPRSIAGADLDGDADPDLAVANGGSNNVTILRNHK